METNKQITQAIASLRTTNGQDFGYKILFGNVTDASSYQEKVIYLNTDGTDKPAQEYTWSEIQAEITALETSTAEAEAQKATDKASGNQKLLDLGLTQAEVDALTK